LFRATQKLVQVTQKLVHGLLFMADARQASARRRVRVRPLGAASKPSTKRTARVGHEDRSPVPGSPKDRLTNI